MSPVSSIKANKAARNIKPRQKQLSKTFFIIRAAFFKWQRMYIKTEDILELSILTENLWKTLAKS